jgi:hypothetical protein
MFNVGSYLKKLKSSRGIKKVVHVHSDHFEPFMSAQRMGKEDELNFFFNKMKENPWSEKMSLNYIFPLGRTVVGKERNNSEHFGAENDKFLFYLNKNDDYLYKFFDIINKNNMDMQLHIHHERFTKNDFYENRPVEPGNESVFNFISKESTHDLDSKRFEFTVKLYKDMFLKYGGIEKDKWTFVHGCWALNGSDPEICKISDEIEILHRNGCVADFSFPAGRSHCNPKLFSSPTIVKPANMIRSYDCKENILMEWDGNKVSEGFLVWASENSASIYSLDFYGKKTSDLISPDKRVIRWFKHSPIINNTLYIKTHSHSAHRHYINTEFPLSSEYAKTVFFLLENACTENNVDLEYLSCGDLI